MNSQDCRERWAFLLQIAWYSEVERTIRKLNVQSRP